MSQDERWDEIWSEKRRATSGRMGAFLARDIVHRTVSGILRREIPEPAGLSVMEEGSGTGLVSLGLAEHGATVFLLDKSDEALAFSSEKFTEARRDHLATQASILDLPFRDGSFDVVWSGGVIEHFTFEQQVRILTEMLRVTRPGGKAIVIAPSAGARIYGRAKAYADSRKAWQPGYEVPIASLGDVAEGARALIAREYRTGLLAELHFLKYYFGDSRRLRMAWAGLVEITSRILYPLNSLPGYLLVSVFEKES